MALAKEDKTLFRTAEERDKFMSEWDILRKWILEHLNGRKIPIVCKDGRR